MFSYSSILPHLDRQVESLLVRQVMDRSRADCGAFISGGMAAGTSVSALSAPGYAYLLEGSAFYRSEELVARIRAGAAFAHGLPALVSGEPRSEAAQKATAS